MEDGGLTAARAVLTSSAALLCPRNFRVCDDSQAGSNTTRDVTHAELEGDSECRRVLWGLSIVTYGGWGRARRPQHQELPEQTCVVHGPLWWMRRGRGLALPGHLKIPFNVYLLPLKIWQKLTTCSK